MRTCWILGVVLGTFLCGTSASLFGQSAAKTESGQSADDLAAAAERIHRNGFVFDAHNDLPWELRKFADPQFERYDVAQPQPKLHTDIPRLRRGNVGAQFWSAYVPAETSKRGESLRTTLEQIELIRAMIRRYPDDFEAARTADDVVRIQREGKIASLIGIEGGHSIENSLGALRQLHALGAGYMTLTHSDTLDWADSATDERKHGGLSAFGEEVVREMNRLGMLVDISHVSTETMHDALDVTRAPVIASHSSAYAVAQHPRNVPDDVLKRLPANGGVVLVNFFSGFIEPESAKARSAMFHVRRELTAKYPDETEFQKHYEAWQRANPIRRGNVGTLVDHIDHIAKTAGIDHVGIGSDYDGITLTPEGLEDVSCYPNITRELLRRGYTEPQIHKIMSGNLLRVMRAAEQVAAAATKTPKNEKAKDEQVNDDRTTEKQTNAEAPRAVLLVHGGAGVISRRHMTADLEREYLEGLAAALRAGHAALQKEGGTSLDGVAAAITVLEDSPLFNAGKGAAFTREGKNELDASIMDGRTGQAGAVASVTTIKNPILAARFVMEKSGHVLMVGEGAEQFAKSCGVELVDPSYFRTERRWQQYQNGLRELQEREEQERKRRPATPGDDRGATLVRPRPEDRFGTVGAVAVDRAGNVAAGTSTGGLSMKRHGRVGDSPILGAGNFADNRSCAVSSTGDGEFFLRAVAAHEISALVKYKGLSLAAAADDVINRTIKEAGGEGAVIVLNSRGEFTMCFNSEGMYRGYVTADGKIRTFIYAE